MQKLTMARTILGADSVDRFQPKAIELASPFLITVLIILVSALLVPLIVRSLSKHFEEGWAPEELKNVLPARSPKTHAAAAIWAMDAAQIPSMLGTPAASAVLLFHTLPKDFIDGYTAVLAVGLIFFVIFIMYIPPLWYRRHSLRIWRLRFTPLVLTGIGLNFLGAGISAFVIK
jgi:hypothetical protein